jgi:N-formylglutamate deformylase
MSVTQTPEGAAPSVIWRIEQGDSPLVAAAIHDGHSVRGELQELFALDEAQRLREEDPFTGGWTAVAPTRITGTHSRFEVDLNRPREKAVYLTPDDAWGLNVWKSELPQEIRLHSQTSYDNFYHEVEQVLLNLERKFGHFVVFDLHSYNHRRAGASVLADPVENPEVNIGTGSMNRLLWAPLINRFIADLRAFNYMGRSLDVRENVKFQGGQFSRWVHQKFPASGCSIAIEWKKFFMDEWSGKPDDDHIQAIHAAMESTVPGVLEELRKL